jgi:hypothetical protein
MDSMSIFDVFRPIDKQVFLALWLISVVYAIDLQIWSQKWPESFADNTYMTVVIGVGYVLLALGFLLSWEAWLRVCAAFFVACLPIVARSLVNHAKRRREANGFNEDGGEHEL